MALIETSDLWKTYVMGSEEIHALRGVSVQIERGEYVAIMGPSGSGKSTLMNLVGCLDTPSRGTYLLNGKEVSQMNDNELARIRNEEIVLVTHEPEVAVFAHRVIHIRDGQVEKDVPQTTPVARA